MKQNTNTKYNTHHTKYIPIYIGQIYTGQTAICYNGYTITAVLFFILTHSLYLTNSLYAQVSLDYKAVPNPLNTPTTYTLNLNFTGNEGEYVYTDYINLSTDSPQVTLSPWHTSSEPISRYDSIFKQTKQIYPEPFTLTLAAHITSAANEPLYPTNIHVIYYKKSDNQITHEIIPLPFTHKQTSAISTASTIHHSSTHTKNISHASQLSTQTAGILKTSHHIRPTYLQILYPLIIMLTCIATAIVYTKRAKNYSFTRFTYATNYIKILLGTLIIVCSFLVYILSIHT